MVCHQTMRQEFDVIEVTVFKDAQDETRTGVTGVASSSSWASALTRQFDEHAGTPFKLFVCFQEPGHRLWRFITSNAQAACHMVAV